MQEIYTVLKNNYTKMSQFNNLIFIVFIILMCVFSGCGGGGGGSDEPDLAPYDKAWTKVEIADLSEEAGGLLSPHVKAIQDKNGIIHFAYFKDEEDPDYNYGIFYKSYNPANGSFIDNGISPVALTERCNALTMTLKSDNRPVIAYQGGTPNACGSAHHESDIMFQVLSQAGWSEYTGAIGYVDPDRNPFYNDGYAGRTISIIADELDNIHTSYQFFYEGCDAMNNELPDQDYILFSPPYTNQGPDGEGEETVEGNTYINFGTALQGRQGDGGKIILNADQVPVVFYIAQIGQTYGIRSAVKNNTGQWDSEWVEIIDRSNYQVGHLSPALAPDGSLGIAFYMEQVQGSELDDSHHLLYSEKQSDGNWITETVNMLSICGEFCTLAYNTNGTPAIAYYVLQNYSNMERKDLVFSYKKDDSTWFRETVSYNGNIGNYNTLWFNDADGTFHISSYSIDEQKVYLFNRYK